MLVARTGDKCVLLRMFICIHVTIREPLDTFLLNLMQRVEINVTTYAESRSQRPHGLRRRSSAARLLRLWVRTPPGHGCLFVLSVVCCQRSLLRADHSSGGVLLTVMRRCVWLETS